MAPVTRTMSSRQLEEKLQFALLELKTSKDLSEQLLKEREDSEREVLDNLNKYERLKCECADMHKQLQHYVEKSEQLQRLVDESDRDRSEFEAALRRIHVLELNLRDAHRQISELECFKLDSQASQTLTLFDELVGSPSTMNTTSPHSNISTIDLTGNNTPCPKMSLSLSKNKLKKYVKVNRYINKTQKLVNKNKSIFKNVSLIKERNDLISELNNCQCELENCRINSENDNKLLTSQIDKLLDSLHLMSIKYETAQREIHSHTQAMDELLKSCKDNQERFESLQKYICCNCNDSPSIPTSPVSDCGTSQSLSIKDHEIITSLSPNVIKNQCTNLIIYSDEIGKNMGCHLSQYYNNNTNVINNCMPGADYSRILETILSSKFENSSVLVILIGKPGNVNREDLATYVSRLDEITNIKKIILFTFPFCINASYDNNNIRHNQNMMLHNLTCYNNKFHCIDFNSIIKKYYSVRGRFYLNRFYRRQIALSLSYYLDSANLLVNLTTASIEQSNRNDIIYIYPSCDSSHNYSSHTYSSQHQPSALLADLTAPIEHLN